MRFEKRTVKSTGETYYSFVLFDPETNKRTRISREDTRNRFGKDITTEEEAIRCLGLLEAEVDSAKARCIKRLTWKDKYYSFGRLLELYESKRKRKAPNSYKNNVFYLKYYVLHYFLNIKELNNINLWYDHYEDFKLWLEKDACLVRKPQQKISYASKNHSIKALNVFMRHLKEENVITEVKILEAFEEHLLNERTADDLVIFEQMVKIEQSLRIDGNHQEADFYRFLYYTGLRFNEAIGISFVDLYQGDLENGLLKNLIDKNSIKYFGYLLLDSQPAAQNRAQRDPVTLKVPRKPLKGRKKISEKNCRIIPIIDKTTWNLLVMRAKQQYDLYQKGSYGSDKKDYLLFDCLSKATSATRLREAHKKEKLRYKCWHLLRHTRGTLLFGETGDRELSKMWLGHSSNKVFEKYNHTYQQMVRGAKKSTRERDGLGLEMV